MWAQLQKPVELCNNLNIWLLQAGYRHVDTAAQYGIEKEVYTLKGYSVSVLG
jgi:diketogulonate reductase-like aldo/keto reductase